MVTANTRRERENGPTVEEANNKRRKWSVVERGGQNQPASQWNEPPRATSLKRILRNRRCSLSSSASSSSLWWSSRGRVRSRRSSWSTWIWSRDAPCDGNWWNVTNGSLHRPPRLRNWNDTRFLCFLLSVRETQRFNKRIWISGSRV